MRTRIGSSLIVIIVGLVPALVGGPVFALLLIALGIAGFREFLQLSALAGLQEVRSYALTGYSIIGAFGITALYSQHPIALFTVTTLAVAAPLVLNSGYSISEGASLTWSLTSAGSLYLGLPVFAAIALRSLPGGTDAAWLSTLSKRLSVGSDATFLGLAWTLTIILCTWVGDSAAYLIGRSFGRYRLAPRVSPNKTVEGAAAGLLSSAMVGAISIPAFGLGVWWLGLVVGSVVGVAGQLGDLVESRLKRQAGAKDSGSLIPGHGGVLDRIDALLFAFPAGLLLASGLEWLKP